MKRQLAEHSEQVPSREEGTQQKRRRAEPTAFKAAPWDQNALPTPIEVFGEIFVLGQGDCGQFGKGDDYLEAKLPILSSIVSNRGGQHPGEPLKVRSIAGGGVHSLAVTADRQVYSTGVNDEGALGRKTETKVWQQAGAQLGTDLECSDDFAWGIVPVPNTEGALLSVSAGDSHSVALTDTGAVWAWGTFRDAGGVYGFSPQQKISLLPLLSLKPSTPSDAVKKIASGTDHVLALTASGKVLSWGTGWQGQLGRVTSSTFSSFTAAKDRFKPVEKAFEAAESAKVMVFSKPDAAKADQQAADKDYAQAQAELEAAKAVFDPVEQELRQLQLQPAEVPLPARAVDIACGFNTSFVIDDRGQVWSFGLDNFSQASAEPLQPGVNKDMRFIYEPRQISPLAGKAVAGIAGGEHHTLVLLSSGQVLSFGRTTYGRLGRLNDKYEENEARERPELVDGLFGVDVASVSAGQEVSACISTSGRAFLWGTSTNAQLGNAGKGAGLRNAGLEEHEMRVEEDDVDLDEPVPCRLDSSRLRNYRILRVEFGGQHTLLLACKHGDM